MGVDVNCKAGDCSCIVHQRVNCHECWLNSLPAIELANYFGSILTQRGFKGVMFFFQPQEGADALNGSETVFGASIPESLVTRFSGAPYEALLLFAPILKEIYRRRKPDHMYVQRFDDGGANTGEPCCK